MTDLNTIENLGIKRILDRGTGKIVAENEGATLYFDSVSEAYFLACDDEDAGIKLLEDNSQFEIRLLSVTNLSVGNKIYSKYDFDEKLECYQLAYYGEKLELDSPLEYKWADERFLPTFKASYDLISEEEMEQVVKRGSILLAYCDDTLVGFIGEHLEGSMGLLQIFPEYRRKGYASELEKAYINHTLEKGYIPFGQVVKGNEASMKLQEKLGLEKSENLITWMWK